MTDWNSFDEQAKSLSAFSALLYAFTGIYFWDWLLSLDFDWDYITGNRRFGWLLIPYFTNRYLLFCTLISLIIFLNAQSHPANCEALFRVVHVTGNIALGLASTNFAARTLCLWFPNVYVTVILCLLVFGNWVITIIAAQGVRATWLPLAGCLLQNANYHWLLVVNLYAIFFDFVVLGLNVYKLGFKPHQFSTKGTLSLSSLLFKQGLIYFIVAFLGNLVEVVMIFLNLSIVMNAMFSIPVVTISTIAACRSVRSLHNHILHNGNVR
ncbi:hypothetical protein CPB83DRAFT_882316 [Crepidotus variabilis]|uniref:Uncharacterized protein n=1 Tax=Crepidotus variabilis TaxID=179855 RepID=A0A9P6EJW9_9AGAR|nr:hypothetical protein CPB83DRAFT_882316 [Crepidotus variabilis]